MNNSGKVLTVFLVVIAIVLICLTAISIFFFQKEIELRKTAQATIEQLKESEAKLGGELKEVLKQVYLLEEKEKESDEKINGLLDEVELEQGLRSEMKIEIQSLKETTDNAIAEKDRLLGELEGAKGEIIELETELARRSTKISEMEKKNIQLEANLKAIKSGKPIALDSESEEIKLKKIVISQPGDKEGRILSVDIENEFIIVNLGVKDGINEGAVVSVFRKERYIGDAKVTRVQPEMSAADFIPPLSGRKVQKNDRILVKK